jgi:putative addiction module component (TIGR02574 family)
MPTTLTPELIEQVRNLSVEDRTILFEETQEKEYTEEELQEEIEARIDEYESGRATTYTLDEVMTALRTRQASRGS